jgi:GT2 family glycosyltransferase
MHSFDNIPFPVRISCIIPTLNRGRVLCDTVAMLLAQSYAAHEIIIVDQTPEPDEETQRALTVWNEGGKIRWLRQREPNASKARNIGAVAATGDVLLFLDDDIRIKPDFLAAYAETFQRTNAVGVAGQVLEDDAKEVDQLPPKAFDLETGWLYFRKNYSKECETSFMISCNAAVRRDVFLAVGGMDENYIKGAYREETDFAMRFLRAGHRFYYSPKCSIYHLGANAVQGGGARSWWTAGKFWYFHHCVGDWYFFLGNCSWRNWYSLLYSGLRAFVLNRQSRERPWRIPTAMAVWLAGLPVAAWRRWNGPVLIDSNRVNAASARHM